ncbi:MAG: hypothetical protein FJW20_12580 [Acidimicrobiia bacterium]|nr:hypothetical protein [Acidimicrobiia bacterium]
MRFSQTAILAISGLAALHAQVPPPTDAEMENFLRTAKVVSAKSLNVGITNSQRLTLEAPERKHDAHFQTIDEYKASFQTAIGTEINFRDSWKYNVAGYKLDRLLNLNMTPVTIERKIHGKSGSLTWWVDDVAMMEVDRHKNKMQPPDQEAWNCQMHVVRVFDQLIYNIDRNLQNLLITTDWKLWMIDHTRAFRLFQDLREPKNLTRCDRTLMERLKQLSFPQLVKTMKGYLNELEVKGLLARRDKIVRLFEQRAAQDQDVLYDMKVRR